MERKKWIDLLRGVCMMLIILYHTEVYYCGSEAATPYYVYTTNAVTLFYFISGYLFFRPSGFDIRHKLWSIVRTLLVPYFVFTLLIAVPKALVHGLEISMADILLKIITGRASWFVAALAVAETLFSLFLSISKRRQWLLPVLAAVCFVAYTLVPYNQYNAWQWQDALLAVPFLCTGYFYHRYEPLLQTLVRPSYSLAACLLLTAVKAYEHHAHYDMHNISITNYPLFLLDTLLAIAMLTAASRRLPSSRLVEWTGSHSIVYYFLSGGVPVCVSILLQRCGLTYDAHAWRLMAAFVLCYLLATLATWMIYRYVPFITGKRHG